jgi:formylglycine-generating enzyme required for sulfatase activity
MQCPSCRNYIEEDGDYCEYCGARVADAAAEMARLSRERTERERAALREAERQQADREAAERYRVEREKAAQEQLARERLAREQAERERVENERIERKKAAQEKQERERAEEKRQRVERSKQGDGAPSVEIAAKEPPAEVPKPFATSSSEDSIDEFGLPLRSQWAASTSHRTFIIAATLALLLIGIVSLFFLKASRAERTPTATGNNVNDAHRAQSAPVVPEGMVYVSGGAFKMGRDNGSLDERPVHEVTLKPFFIDRYEVTCEQYRKFIESTGHRAPKTWPGGMYPPERAHWPVTGVTWSDATAYASWAGKRLPTEAEWELAARGTDGRLYPWGNQWVQSEDRSASANAFITSAGQFIDVGTFKGASPHGAYDMVGNAWEWTASDWAAYPGGTLAKVPPYQDMKTMRGNYWEADDQHATTTFRIGWPADATDVNVSYKNAGFRCAKDAQ